MRHLLLALALLPLTAQAPKARAEQATSSSVPDVTVAVHGAAGEVDGSLTVVRHGDRTYLVDCGIHLSGDRKRNQELPVDASKVDAVFITHAHADHAGKLPFLVKKGFKGPIHCARPSDLLMAVALPMGVRMDDTAHRAWTWSRGRADRARTVTVAHFSLACSSARLIGPTTKANYSGTLLELKERIPGLVIPCKECPGPEGRRVMEQVKGHAYGERMELPGGGAFTLLDAGHIPGSASILLELSGKRLLFSGDMGHDLNPLLHPPVPAPKVDAVWVECTYGGQTRKPEVATQEAELVRGIADTVKAGGLAWIPAYAMDRSQKVLFLVRQAQQKGLIPKDTPVHLPSPSAIAYTQIYDAEAEKPNELQAWFKPEVYQSKGFWPHKIDRENPKELAGAAILITTTFMLDDPAQAEQVATRLRDPKTRIFLVGYSDPEAAGGQLKKIARSGQPGVVQLNGVDVAVHSDRVKEFHFLSGHLDFNDLKTWLGRQDKATLRVTCVHGDPSGLQKQKEALKAEGFMHVEVAQRGQAQVF